ncbi:hypothetical protein [Vibrio barjaei]|uniref:hypothetical protein n=1 Tax=Vibrio barjaei TaxID=1676683 RepID=UPI0022833574|nr:hypothetical protein [Vibrio barjaei]MCY9870486.1 hypothetical protein [Vibrio barjaei]
MLIKNDLVKLKNSTYKGVFYVAKDETQTEDQKILIRPNDFREFENYFLVGAMIPADVCGYEMKVAGNQLERVDANG